MFGAPLVVVGVVVLLRACVAGRSPGVLPGPVAALAAALAAAVAALRTVRGAAKRTAALARPVGVARAVVVRRTTAGVAPGLLRRATPKALFAPVARAALVAITTIFGLAAIAPAATAVALSA